MSDLFGAFHFLYPLWFLTLIPYAGIFYYVYRLRKRAHETPGRGVIPDHLAQILKVDVDEQKGLRTLAVTSVVYCLAVVALAQPVWRHDPGAQESQSPLLIVLDESASMAGNDVAPTREKKAHLLLSAWLSTRALERPVAILVFAGTAHLLLPPSEDLGAVVLYLGYVDTSVMPRDGSDAASVAALMAAVPALHAPGTDVLLVTDGIESGIDALVEEMRANGMEWVTLALTDLGRQAGRQLGGDVLSGDTMALSDPALANAVSAFGTDTGNARESWRDETSWFIFPIACLTLLWFRRGWALRWTWVLVAATLLGSPDMGHAGALDFFFSRDQQAMIAMHRGHFGEAAVLFQDPQWKGVACYYAENFDCAQDRFSTRGDLDGLNNFAAAAAQAGDYKLASQLYAALVVFDPDYPGAEQSEKKMAELVESIDRFTKSQQDERPPSEKAGNKDQRNKANGDKQTVMGAIERETLRASDVLQSDAATEKWLRDISRDPKAFFRNKFAIEAERKGGRP